MSRQGLMDDSGYYGFEECSDYEICCEKAYEQGRADAIEEFIELFDETWETDTSESWVTFVHQLADKVKKGE